jgi:hypothetical protein
MNFKKIGLSLVPLERMDSAKHTWFEAIFDVVVYSQIGFNQKLEIFNNFALILF